jgi:hypothetical protein
MLCTQRGFTKCQFVYSSDTVLHVNPVGHSDIGILVMGVPGGACGVFYCLVEEQCFAFSMYSQT